MDKSMQRYVVNPNYMMKNDTKRVFLSYRYNGSYIMPKHYLADPNHASFIHPEHAKIFALFDGKKDLSEIVEIIASRLCVPSEKAKALVEKYIENDKKLGVTFRGDKFAFPEHMLVPYCEDVPFFTYGSNDFDYDEVEFKDFRLIEFPQDVTLMLNTICETDCIYCYADCRKKTDCQIPIETVAKLIDDCKANGVRSLNLMGGEILKYKHWEWLVEKMMNNGYEPLISTKMPIKKWIVDKLHELGTTQFQISLDSFDPQIIEKNLCIANGANYLDNMRQTLLYLEQVGIDLRIHGVVTAHNKHISHWEPYLDELKKYSNISYVELTTVGESLYKHGYQGHKINEEDVRSLIDLGLKVTVPGKYPFTINISSGVDKTRYLNEPKVKEEKYKKRSICTGNVRQVFILPDGGVTICEELMFNPNFLLGNIIDEDLQTIWKKNRLKHLEEKATYHNSRCGKCKSFSDCKGTESRGVCWKEIIHAYGEDKWNYPDPKCPYAPTEMRPFYV